MPWPSSQWRTQLHPYFILGVIVYAIRAVEFLFLEDRAGESPNRKNSQLISFDALPFMFLDMAG
jgi:hypothetical protein